MRFQSPCQTELSYTDAGRVGDTSKTCAFLGRHVSQGGFGGSEEALAAEMSALQTESIPC